MIRHDCARLNICRQSPEIFDEEEKGTESLVEYVILQIRFKFITANEWN